MKTTNWRNLLVSVGILGIFLLSSTPLLATPPQDKAMKDDGVGIGKTEQLPSENPTLGNTEGGTDPSGPRDRDPGEIKTLADRAKDEEAGKTSQGSGNNEKIPNAYAAPPAKNTSGQ